MIELRDHGIGGNSKKYWFKTDLYSLPFNKFINRPLPEGDAGYSHERLSKYDGIYLDWYYYWAGSTNSYRLAVLNKNFEVISTFILGDFGSTGYKLYSAISSVSEGKGNDCAVYEDDLIIGFATASGRQILRLVINKSSGAMKISTFNMGSVDWSTSISDVASVGMVVAKYNGTLYGFNKKTFFTDSTIPNYIWSFNVGASTVNSLFPAIKDYVYTTDFKAKYRIFTSTISNYSISSSGGEKIQIIDDTGEFYSLKAGVVYRHNSNGDVVSTLDLTPVINSFNNSSNEQGTNLITFPFLDTSNKGNVVIISTKNYIIALNKNLNVLKIALKTGIPDIKNVGESTGISSSDLKHLEYDKENKEYFGTLNYGGYPPSNSTRRSTSKLISIPEKI